MKKLRLAIDFDNTIATAVENEFPKIGPMIDGADIYINKLYDDGHVITINTCRSGRYEGQAIDFLKQHGIKFHWCNCNAPDDIIFFGQDCRKISSDIYIDDKNILGIPPWKDIYKIVTEKSNE